MKVWGMLRAARGAVPQRALVQWRGAGGGYRTIASVNTDDPSGFLTSNVKPPGSGSVRIQWVSPSGVTLHSRAVAVQQR